MVGDPTKGAPFSTAAHVAGVGAKRLGETDAEFIKRQEREWPMAHSTAEGASGLRPLSPHEIHAMPSPSSVLTSIAGDSAFGPGVPLDPDMKVGDIPRGKDGKIHLRVGSAKKSFPPGLERAAAENMEQILGAIPDENRRAIVNEMMHGAFTVASAKGYIEGFDAALAKLEDIDSRLKVLGGMRPDQQRRLADAYQKTGHFPHNMVAMAQERLNEIESIERERRELRCEIIALNATEINDKAMEELLPVGEHPVLQRLTETKFHGMMDADAAGAILAPGASQIPHAIAMLSPEGAPHIFVVQHDWAAAFKHAQDFEGGEWKLPYNDVAFEFRISGKRTIVLCGSENGHFSSIYMLTESSYGWIVSGVYEIMPNGDPKVVVAKAAEVISRAFFGAMEPLARLCLAQIRAVSISLEADVAETEVVRAPHKLNRQREKKGRVPIFDYHIVNLTARKRYAPRAPQPGDIDEERHHKRMHWVRGHWRHYTNSKTWIKWHLRGDPDLGFIDKEYRL